MNNKTIANFNRFGRIGKIVMTILIVLTILATIAVGGVAAAMTVIPQDSVVINTTTNVETVFDTNHMGLLKDMLIDNYATTYDGEIDLDQVVDETGTSLADAIDQEYQSITVAGTTYSDATVTTDGGRILVKGAVDNTAIDVADLTGGAFAITALMIIIVVAEFMLRAMFARLAVCESVFDTTLVNRLRNFGWTLLPMAIVSTVAESMINGIARTNGVVQSGISLDWGTLIAFAITMIAVVILRYGVELQQASDETL